MIMFVGVCISQKVIAVPEMKKMNPSRLLPSAFQSAVKSVHMAMLAGA